MKRNVLSLFLALVLCLTLSIPAFASEYDFDVSSNGVLIHYSGSDGHVIVPDGVIAIGRQAFDECSSMTSISIPDTVFQIGTDAFHGCTGLTSLYLPNSMTQINRNAFGGCTGLTRVFIPSSVTYMGTYVFSGCTSLTSVTIPGSVESVRWAAFKGCTSLTDVVIEPGVTAIDSSINEGTFQNCTSLVNVTIPDTVTEIGGSAFANCTSLTGITIPDSVTSMTTFTFMGCPNLTIYGSAGSYAESFAKAERIPFVVGEAPHIDTGNEPSNLPSLEPPSATGALAFATSQTAALDGQEISFQNYALRDANGNGTNYIKLRDLADVLNGTAAQFEVGYDNGIITITTGRPYTPNGTENNSPYSGDQPYTESASKVLVNGQEVTLASFAITYNDGGYTYFQLRDLGRVLGFNVGWDGQAMRMFIQTDRPYTDAD